MIRGFEFRLNRDTGLMTVDDQEIENVDRLIVEDTDAPHSVDVDDKLVITQFSRPVTAEIVEVGGERRVEVSEK